MSFLELRKEMVKNQIEARGITDQNVIRAISEIPRENFVPDNLKNSAYEDNPLLIGNGQTISQPYIVAKMTEMLEISEKNSVLEIGTGSGYQAAVLSKLSSRVFSIERIPALRREAEEKLKRIGVKNVLVMNGDGTIGLSQYAPYDRIIVTAAGPEIPKNLLDQLKDNGIIVMPVGSRELQVLVKAVKREDRIVFEEHDYCTFVPLIGKHGFLEDGV